MNETLRTVLLGVVGLCVAIALSVAALQLTSQDVGITAEPVDAGSDLAPSQQLDGRAESVLDEARKATSETHDQESRSGEGTPTDQGGDGDAGSRGDEDGKDERHQDDHGGEDHGDEDDD